MSNALQTFRDILNDKGLIPSAIIADGTLHRCPTQAKPHKQNGAYIAHLDVPATLWWCNWESIEQESALRERVQSFERQAEEAEKALAEQSHIPPASMFNFKSALERANSIIEWQKKSLAVKNMVSAQNEKLRAEVKELYEKVDRYAAAYDQEKKRGNESFSRLLKEQDKTLVRLEEYEKFFRWNQEANKMHMDYLEERRQEAQRKAAEQKRQAEERAQRQEEERARQAKEQERQKALEAERQREEREAEKAHQLERRSRGMGQGR